ncbi:hypothetical protein METBIDRAFT_9128 [Metschnikowia bicuspidata var. bicuspidata NRRL YB-4993]|uniref:LDB19 N-terminal domain-containing protein n=1 Tax=Metschnikowia bicuspidata var. bicuspidata NRRL YB-4993 TaxID=869754 RepID=A0A1A0HFJ0_9ASCO|nr:hypothetical protein METBIDRAFT_9128 [Metschnikowia bicuspidata var. bicuspidata NRRL YB-4993]OBA22766.1 hypothetical protein METBIDRAFT_9128 [Metschnikowia bicuspidata var. bicuspidata NRRL YB-4993]
MIPLSQIKPRNGFHSNVPHRDLAPKTGIPDPSARWFRYIGVLHHHTDKNSKRPPRSTLSPSSAGSSNPNSGSSLISLNINLESPPVVLYGHAHESTGSLISGVLTLNVHPQFFGAAHTDTLSPQTSYADLYPQNSARSGSSEAYSADGQCLSPVASSDTRVDVDSVVLLLVQTMHYTKPFIVLKNTLAQWDVLLQNSSFPTGSHAYPFSHLIPGLLAASSKLGSAHSYTYIKYDLVAIAKCAGRETRVTLPVNILRSIVRGPDRNSLRVFPPTEVTANAVLPGVMYPKSTFPIELRMGHVVNSRQDRRWRLRKLLWKLEEHTQIAAHSCPQHTHKLKLIEETQRKAQLANALRTGTSPKNGASPSMAGNGPSKSNGMHHLTIQTLMFVSHPPANTQGAIRAAAIDASNMNDVPVGNHDIVEPEEEVPTNRVFDEVVHFEEDFGNTAASQGDETSDTGDATPASPAELEAISNVNSRTDSPAQLSGEERSSEALFHDELRVVAHGDIKSGWKSDFLGEGTIELVAEISALECSSGIKLHSMKALSEDTPPNELLEGLRNDANISCDIDDPVLGVYVGHVLVLEVIIAEEIVLHSKHSQVPKEGLTPVESSSSVVSASNVMGVPTGAARVLRMQFKVVMTERSGLGIAWDDEVPPMYEDVRALSPPTYETLAVGTPNSLHGLLPALSGQRTTPSVIYGLGDTPVVGSFVPNRTVHSIDAMTDLDDSVQEFRL